MTYRLTVLPRPTPLERAQLVMRAHLCGRCPSRSIEDYSGGIDTPRACEAVCEFFRRLPYIVQIARGVDPTAGSFGRIIDTQIREICQKLAGTAEARRNFILMHRPQIVGDLWKIVAHGA